MNTDNLRARILAQYGSEKLLSAAMKEDPRTLATGIDRMKEINIDEAREALFQGFTDEQYETIKTIIEMMFRMSKEKQKLFLTIMDLVTDRPDRQEVALSWTGEINDLPAALEKI